MSKRYWGSNPDRPEDAERLPTLIEGITAFLDLVEDRFGYITYRRTEELWPLHLARRLFRAAGLRSEPVDAGLESLGKILPPHPGLQAIQAKRKLRRTEKRARQRLLGLLRQRILDLAGGADIVRAIRRSGRIRRSATRPSEQSKEQPPGRSPRPLKV